ncbi:MAG: 30S ribosomal protein S20 [Candidatus Colwellbacteria bacterium RBG_13_48_8]|uniref:Small ribosomal subunit protein bS20 n=1 Tax=Candidatus Colwellbacteria bacterium RBG_13_48_8 TaxID=1797685 RepID=A0A1G1YXW6_9BACT|nr:MAG: 30S ribosomal protein S20 [Candidatus Colwellbacteria bacterium RBG_13_48_8]
MPKTRAAQKAWRQNLSRRQKNLKGGRELKQAIKDFKKAVESKNAELAAEKLPIIYKKLDKAAKTNLIKKNKANRLKSRLTKSLGAKRGTSPVKESGGKTPATPED